MAFELTLMIVSGLGIIALLTHKYFELSSGMESRVKTVREKTDPILENIKETSGRAVSRFTVSGFVFVLNQAFVHLVRFLMNISKNAHVFSARLVEKASRKTEDLSRGGAASFYLKQIKETKEEAQISPEATKEREM